MNMISIRELSFEYPSGTRALKSISLDIPEGAFVLLCGASGCGKSTLLRLMKQGLAPRGKVSGSVQYFGEDMRDIPSKTAAEDIGFVMQSPESQIVTDKVWHELAFSLESIGAQQQDMRRRVGEMASYFDLESRLSENTATLSGGQKQLLALASAAAVHPKLLLLDEPTSQLDPISARNLIEAITRLNRDHGVTVIIAEHRLEELLCVSDRIIVMDSGSIIADCSPRDICKALPEKHPMAAAMPVSVRLFAMGGGKENAPLTIREGRNNAVCRDTMEKLPPASAAESADTAEPVITAKELWVSYRKGADVLSSASVTVRKGKVLAILGSNGSGKTTLLKCLLGAIKPLGGRIKRKKGAVVAYLPQEPCELFTCETVREELAGDTSALIPESLYDSHPYDLSGGEQQRLAIAKLLSKNPDVLLMDEPTKGMDSHSKDALAKLLRELAYNGMAIVLVTHDTELAAACADTCAMLSGGEIISEDSPSVFFSENYFYTTAARRLTRGIRNGIITI